MKKKDRINEEINQEIKDYETSFKIFEMYLNLFEDFFTGYILFEELKIPTQYQKRIRKLLRKKKYNLLREMNKQLNMYYNFGRHLRTA